MKEFDIENLNKNYSIEELILFEKLSKALNNKDISIFDQILEENPDKQKLYYEYTEKHAAIIKEEKISILEKSLKQQNDSNQFGIHAEDVVEAETYRRKKCCTLF